MRMSRPYNLAQRIIIAAFKIVLPDVAARIEGIATIADLIVAPQKAATVTRLLEDNARHLAKRLQKLESIDYVGLDEVNKGLAVNAVHTAIERSNITKSDIIRKRMGGNDILKVVEPLARKEWNYDSLPEVAIRYGQRYLQEAAAFLASIVRQLPDFSDELLVANYDLTYKIHELVRDGINNVVLPRYRSGESEELSAFEAEYRSSIISDNDTMEVFGLNVPEELRQQRIDIAYITLKASTLGDPAVQESQLGQQSSEIDPSDASIILNYPTQRVDEAIGEIAHSIMSFENTNPSSQSSTGTRILLSGEAGSGKTTIARWLAIKAAQHNFLEALESWNACMPFIVPLREVFRSDSQYQPNIEDLLHPASLRASLPGGWLVKQLTRDALILLDGLDELSRAQRTVFGKWVRKLCRDFPTINILITSRPHGIDSEWFSEMNFTQLRLQPMALPDIRRCIGAWFKAMLIISIRDRDQHLKEQARLIADIERQNTLQDLASTPLLCAMLCAFYAYKHTTAPETRGELYHEVIKTLIHERDYERDSERADLVALPQKQRWLLLQGLARYMTDESLTTITSKKLPRESSKSEWPSGDSVTAIDIVEHSLRRMSLLATNSDEALRILLDRSIVFRRVGYNEAHFAHRSIQEYLTACDYADEGLVEQLINHTEDSKWWSAIAFSAGRLTMKDTSKLVSGILEIAARSSGAGRRSLIMLAAECYVVRGGLEEQVANSVKNMIMEVFPPTSDEEADMVARCGSQVLPLLASQPGFPDQVAAACVRAAAAIGGSEALTAIAQYAKNARGRLLINEVVNGWQQFDPQRYADEVLRLTKPGDEWVNLRTAWVVSAAGTLSTMKKARIEAFEGSYDFRSWSSLRGLEEIDFTGNWRLRSLKGISNIRGLRKLNLSGTKELESIDELADLGSLRELSLKGCSGLKNISALGNLTQLKVLILDSCSNASDFTFLSRLNELTMLSVNGCKITDLSWCSELPKLRRLHAVTRDGTRDASALVSCGDLYWLDIRVGAYPDSVINLPSGGNLRRLLVKGSVDPVDLMDIGQHGNLSELSLEHVNELQDLNMVSNLTSLQSIAVTDCHDLFDASAIAQSSALEEVDLSGSVIEDVEFLRNLARLSHVKLNRCVRLRDISALTSLPSLEYVSTLNIFRNVRPSPNELRDMVKARRQVIVVHDPLVVGHYEQPVGQFEDDNAYDADADFGLFYGDQG